MRKDIKIVSVTDNIRKVKSSSGNYAVDYVADLPFIDYKTKTLSYGRKGDMIEFFWRIKDAQNWINSFTTKLI